MTQLDCSVLAVLIALAAGFGVGAATSRRGQPSSADESMVGNGPVWGLITDIRRQVAELAALYDRPPGTPLDHRPRAAVTELAVTEHSVAELGRIELAGAELAGRGVS